MPKYSVKQIYENLHTIIDQTLGRTDVLKEDLTNLVDIGRELFDTEKVDHYVKRLVAHIGRVIVANKFYKGSAPSVMMDSWDFGAVLEKIEVAMPKATANESWNLSDGASYDPNVFHAPKVRVKFFQDAGTYDYEMSFPIDQVRGSFSNANQMSAFISAVETSIMNAKTADFDNLIMATINYSIAETVASAFPDKVGENADYSEVTHVKAVNLLKLYNDKFGEALTPANCIENTGFQRFATKTIGNYVDRMQKLSVLFNDSGDKDYPKFTEKDSMHIVLLSDFARASDVYLQADTYHNEMTKLPEYETVPYWQGSGVDYSFESASDIHVNIKVDEKTEKEIHIPGVIGTIFDRNRLAVCNAKDETDTNHNGKGRFLNYFYHSFAQRFVDKNENSVVFFVA